LVKLGTPLSEVEICELLANEKTGWLATVSPENKPHLIPIHYGFFEGKVHVVFVHKKNVSLRHIQNDGSVCFGVNVGERAGEIKCVLVYGKGKIGENGGVLFSAYSKILTKYLPSKEDAESFLRKLMSSRAIERRTLVVIEPQKMISWKL